MQNFINEIASFATITSTPKKIYTATPAQKFVKAAKAEIAKINNGADTGKWFKKENGQFTLKLRNGNKIIELVTGKSEIVVNDAPTAIRVIESAIANCQKGEFNALFDAQKIVRKARV